MRKPVLDAHCLTLQKEILRLEQENDELVMEKLKKIDQVAYVRFASVYREFKDINSFLQELKVILEHEKS